MIPKFSFYFYPFLKNLDIRESCRLFDLCKYVGEDLQLTTSDLNEYTKGGKVKRHISRMNYCASYLKKMGLVENFSMGSYRITEKGRKILEKFGDKLSLSQLRELPEFIATQINAYNTDAVYVKPHKRGHKMIGPYICNKNLLRSKNPNIMPSVSDAYRESLTTENCNATEQNKLSKT